MTPVLVGQYRLRVDADATRAAQALRPAGGPEECSCVHCRNWVAARPTAYSREFRQLLETLGLAPDRESEVAHYGEIQPGFHLYGGWFHFIGVIDGHDDQNAVPAPAELTAFHTDSVVIPEPLKHRPLVQLEFSVTTRWLLDESDRE